MTTKNGANNSRPMVEAKISNARLEKSLEIFIKENGDFRIYKEINRGLK
jgi:hypothetical protein